MSRVFFRLFVAGMLVAESSLFADEGSKKEGPSKEKALLQMFDADGDGKLNEAELGTLKQTVGKLIGDKGAPAKGPAGQPSKEEILKRFDKNKDGELNEEEKQAAMAALKEHQKEGKPEGKPAPEKNAKPSAEAASKFTKEEIMKKFDKDGDGKLNDEEMQSAKAALKGDQPQDKKPAPDKTKGKFEGKPIDKNAKPEGKPVDKNAKPEGKPVDKNAKPEGKPVDKNAKPGEKKLERVEK